MMPVAAVGLAAAPTPDVSDIVFCVLFAVGSGLACSMGINVVSYTSHLSGKQFLHDTTHWSHKSRLWLAFNVVLNLFGIFLFVMATGRGPVALAMPFETATLLLSNLVIMHVLGMGHFDKACLVGTFTLTFAACCLGEVGPADTTKGNEGDNDAVVAMFSTLGSIGWLFFLVVVAVASVIFIGKPETLKFAVNRVKSSAHNDDYVYFKMLAYSVFVGIATGVGAMVGKVLTLTTGSTRYGFFFIYGILGMGSLVGGALAAQSGDMAIYMATNECFKLLITAFTGVFIWGDKAQQPLSYVMVYLLMCMGAYLCATADPNYAEHKRNWYAILQEKGINSQNPTAKGEPLLVGANQIPYRRFNGSVFSDVRHTVMVKLNDDMADDEKEKLINHFRQADTSQVRGLKRWHYGFQIKDLNSKYLNTLEVPKDHQIRTSSEHNFILQADFDCEENFLQAIKDPTYQKARDIMKKHAVENSFAVMQFHVSL